MSLLFKTVPFTEIVVLKSPENVLSTLGTEYSIRVLIKTSRRKKILISNVT